MSTRPGGAKLLPGFEVVYTVDDYYDGPRQGMADFKGSPHVYFCPFDQQLQDYPERYYLKPVDANALRMHLERFEIFRRWRKEYLEGRTRDIRGALPADEARKAVLDKLLEPIIHVDVASAITAMAEFRAFGDGDAVGDVRALQVRWTRIA